MRSRHVLSLTLALFLAATAVVRADQTDDLIKAEMKRQNIPGLSLAVVKDGKIVKAQGYGFSNIKLRIPATAETVYKICSVSKQFIAAGIMLLVQEDRLGLDDSIGKYLEGTPQAWKEITIRHLLTHTSGLVREAPLFDPFKTKSDLEVIKSTYSLPLRFAAGEKWQYGNVSYFVLAEVISKVSGQHWSEYLTEKIFNPTGMRATHPTNTRMSVPNRAVGYSDNDKLLIADDWPALRPSGAFLSTILDLAKWDAILYTDKILSEATRRQMWTPVKLNDGTAHGYGLGWELGSLSGRRLVHHGGGMPGFRAEFARFTDDRVTIILLMNLDDVDKDAILHGVANFYLPTPTSARPLSKNERM